MILNGTDGKDGKNALSNTVCGYAVYDPSQKFCFEEKLYNFCGDSSYDPTTQFCQSGALYALCGDESYDVATEFCLYGWIYSLCGGKNYDVTAEYCDGDSLVYVGKGAFTDGRDGQTYKTVKIGSQTWMAENLNYNYQTSSCGYGNAETDNRDCATYGRLYTWAAAMDSAALFSKNGKYCGYSKTCSVSKPVRGVCSEGWHLPDTTEWKTLRNFVANSLFDGNLSNQVCEAFKAKGGWNYSQNGSDTVGFGVLPGNGGDYEKFWTATEKNANDAYNHYLVSYSCKGLPRESSSKKREYSVRCIKD